MSIAENVVPQPEPELTPQEATVTEVGSGPVPDVVEVRRHAGVSGVIGAASSAVAIAWFGRAIATGSIMDWVLVLLTGVLGVVWLAAFLDARTPLFVADAQGVRLRLGRNWIGLPWSAVASVEHTERRGLFGDGRLEVVAHNPERLLAGLDPAAARQARWAERIHGGPLALPLGLGTKVVHSDAEEVGAVLAELAAAETSVVVRRPVQETAVSSESVAGVPFEATDAVAVPLAVPAPRPTLAERAKPFLERAAAARSARAEARSERAADRARAAEAERLAAEEAADEAAELERMRAERLAEEAAVEAARQPSPTPEPVREVPDAARADVRRETVAAEPAELSPEDAPTNVRPIAVVGDPVDALVIDDFALEPAVDPVIGPELVAARTRLGMSVDQLAARTRIRPHVIEAIEVDDFAPCGGDFYARGHLRTLAKVLGADAGALLARYDERYAHAPVAARKVFEAELATGSIRGTRGGPNWSLLVAGVMGLVLVWSIVQVVTDSPVDAPETPVLDGSGGVTGGVAEPEPVTVVVTAPEAGAEIVVRDGAGTVVHTGTLAIGEKIEVEAKAPVRVQSTDGSVTVTVDGQDRGAVGQPGDPAQGTYAGD